MKRLHPAGIFLLVLILPLMVFAQGTITGKVTDATSGRALPGANVFVDGTTLGAAADADGNYAIANVPAGSVTVVASVIGYEEARQTVTVSGTTTLNFALESSAIELSALEVFASRATRETPVAFTNVVKEEMQLRLASRDIPMVLNTTPSVYATQQGGGAGDARINVRGFNQRNVAIMINGVPVNDMENGWVYWSNWDGVGDATSSIQMQRGLSAVNLATPSIGGTMNIITDPSAHDWGGLVKQEMGSYGFMKTTANFNTGLLANRFALSGTVVRKTGDGYASGTWTDAWAYYFGASFALSKNDRFELYALGAPQRHGQNLYRQNIGTYSHDYAKDLDTYDPAALDDYLEQGRDFNQNVQELTGSYDGPQYWSMYSEHAEEDRKLTNEISERENFFHKPQVNLNWYHTFNEHMRLSTIIYWSGGHGGGTGTYGDVYRRDADGVLGDDDYKFYYGPGPWQWDWDATIAMNSGSAGDYYVDKDSLYKETGQSLGILRNSRNNQSTIGAISKFMMNVSDNLKLQAGIDWRTADIAHFREVRDLLGGDFYVSTSSDFDTTPESQKKVLGDKIVYNFSNTVDWLGFYGQGEFTSGPLTAYGMAGWSRIAYTYTNHFWDASDDGVDDNENDDGELFIEADPISDIQIKGGASFNLAEGLSVFGNFGIVNKVPIFDFVIDDYNGALNDDPKSENFTSFEGGVNYYSGMFTVKTNYYYTLWKDRSITKGYTTQDGVEGLISLEGVNAKHSGLEIEAAVQPMKMLRVDAAASIGDWIYTDDVEAVWRPDFATDPNDRDTLNLFLKDLKVGDQPQTQYALGLSVFPIKGLTAQVVAKMYSNYHADFDPFDRDDATDRVSSWEVPSYTLIDFHGSYDLPINVGGIRFQAFAHIINLLDATYIQDATDNSQYNAFDYDHDADDAEVFFGMPRHMNFGLNVYF